MEYSTFGRHVAVDTWGVDFELLNNAEWLQAQMVEAAEAMRSNRIIRASQAI